MFKRFQTSSRKSSVSVCVLYIPLPWCIIIPFLLHQTCDFSSRCIKYTCRHSSFYSQYIIWGTKKKRRRRRNFRVPVSDVVPFICLGALVNNFFSILMLSCFIQVDKFKYQPTLKCPNTSSQNTFFFHSLLFSSFYLQIYLLIHFYLFKNKISDKKLFFLFLFWKEKGTRFFVYESKKKNFLIYLEPKTEKLRFRISFHI